MSRSSIAVCAFLAVGALLAASVPSTASHIDLTVVPSDVWVKEPGIRLERGPEDPPGTLSIHTPEVFRFPDGTLRMYYDTFGNLNVRSATSTDGLVWAKEPGIRIAQVGHAHVLMLPDGRFRMYFEDIAGGTLQGIGSAISPDGLTWTHEGLRLPGSFADPIVLEVAAGYRIYFRTGLNLGSALSADGLAFTVEPGLRVLDAREFAIVRLPDGSLVMYYGQATPAFAAILSARSTDGLAWTKDSGARLLPGPVGSLDAGGVLTISILEFPGGVVRMYYQGAPGSDINSEARVFSAVAERPAAPACPRSQGFWKTHSSEWPVSSLVLGIEPYAKGELRGLLWTQPRGDASLILAHQLIAAKLNVAHGSDAAPIDAGIGEADAFLGGFVGRLPLGIRPSTAEGHTATALAATLDEYNNGKLTPGCTPPDSEPPLVKPPSRDLPAPVRPASRPRPTI